MSRDLYSGTEKIFTRHHLVELAGNQGWESFAWNVFSWFRKLCAELLLLAKGSCVESLGVVNCSVYCLLLLK